MKDKPIYSITTTLHEVVVEMRHHFNKWDEKIDSQQQPVPIQDLDYWICQINRVIKTIEDGDAKW